MLDFTLRFGMIVANARLDHQSNMLLFTIHSRHLLYIATVPPAHRMNTSAMSDHIQEHELPDIATSSRSLKKSLAGLRDVFDSDSKGVALLITNGYQTLKWPDNGAPMILRGAEMDRTHVRKFLRSFEFTSRVEIVPIDNALRKDIEDQITKVIDSCPPLLVAYFQGHGDIHDRKTLVYITGDHKECGTLECLTEEDLIKMFAKLSVRTMSVVMTDFCNSGNMYRLRFALEIGSDGSASWCETWEWSEDNKIGCGVRVTSPMIHIAGSLRSQPVYETEMRGGYFTNSLALLDGGPITLPQFLISLRRGVNAHLQDAKAHPSAQDAFKSAEQVPQIFSNHPWPLEDPNSHFQSIRLFFDCYVFTHLKSCGLRCASRQHEQETSAPSPNAPLNKTIFGFPLLDSPGAEPIAFMFTNNYDSMVWPSDRSPMVLRGAVQDRVHAQLFLDRFTPGVRVKGIGNSNALRQDIEDSLEGLAHSHPSLVVAYFQGHSEGKSGPLQYITGDRNEDGTLEGFTAEELIKMFSKLSICTMSMVITDFCSSGNIYRLRFRLVVRPNGERFQWYETDEWAKDNAVDRKCRIASPMIHIAASLESQQAYETERRGGYLTNALAVAEPKSLPEFLLHVRQIVDRRLKEAKHHPRSPLHWDAMQLPQIYCTCKLPLDDSEIFSKIYLGTAKPFYSNFD
ncbi:hypothetical protein OPQ81_003749 [Rhizoctonia solani]|nr:hypothetical protein OPQ81_003749 [Rhizoctonia solani]